MILLPTGMINEPVPPRTYAVWDAATKGAGVTLSGGNLIASFGTANAVVLSTIAVTATKSVWEARVNAYATPAGTLRIGFSSGVVTNRSIGDLIGDYGYQATTGQILNNNSVIATGSAFIVGDIMTVELDLVNNSVVWKKNGVQVATHAVIAGAYKIAASGSFNGGDAVQVNFNATRNFAYPSPNGYNSGVWTDTITPPVVLPDALLRENGYYILKEDGDQILLES